MELRPLVSSGDVPLRSLQDTAPLASPGHFASPGRWALPDPGFRPILSAIDPEKFELGIAMRTSTCLILAASVALIGLGLRLAVPVTPADAAYREVLQFHRTLNPRGSASEL